MNNSKIKLRNEVDDQFKWNIEDIYETNEKWQDDFNLLKEYLPELKRYKGTLENSSNLLLFLRHKEKVDRLYDKLFMYAYLKECEDISNHDSRNRLSLIQTLFVEIATSTSFFETEILQITLEDFNTMISQEPDLCLYKHFIQDIHSKKEHLLSEEAEGIVNGIHNHKNPCQYQ